MMPSLSSYASSLRLQTGVDNQENNNPPRSQYLASHKTRPSPGTLQKSEIQSTPKTLVYAYIVFGVGREPSQWVESPSPSQGQIDHMKGALSKFWLPEILGSFPKFGQSIDIAKYFHSAMKASFPHDIEICVGKNQPECVQHSFVIQQDSDHSMYGVSLRIWTKADEMRTETIRELRRRIDGDFEDDQDETFWIPHSLCFLSRYPLYDLLGDYLRAMWIHCNTATNTNSDKVSYLLNLPAPRLNDLVRIDIESHVLCYRFPASPDAFENFAMWPLFCCLSIPNIIGVVEAALSPDGRIIFTSQNPAMLNLAAETIRRLVRFYEWSGLYLPVVHSRYVGNMVEEPGPYIIGTTTECRSLYTAPNDALVVDLDRNYVLNSNNLTVFTPGQRLKIAARFTQALNDHVLPSGVPKHLQSAYFDGKLVPAGQIIDVHGETNLLQDPEWWNREAVLDIMDHLCEKLGRNKGIKAVFSGPKKKPLMKKVSVQYLNELEREKSQHSRDVVDAWQDFINLKERMDTELDKATTRNNFLVGELESWKQQFLRFQTVVEQLTCETRELKIKIEAHSRENSRLNDAISQYRVDTSNLASCLSRAEQQRDGSLKNLAVEQQMVAKLENQRKRNKMELWSLQNHNANVVRQRDDAQRIVLHLCDLISGQTHQIEKIAHTIDRSEVPLRQTHKAGELPQVIKNSSSPIEAIVTDSIIPISRGTSLANLEKGHCISAGRQLNSSSHNNGYRSNLALVDTADRRLRDKTNDIAEIVRKISKQCADAVEELRLSKDDEEQNPQMEFEFSTFLNSDSDLESETDCGTYGQGHRSFVPQTPDLIQNDESTSISRSSSVYSAITRCSSFDRSGSTVRSSLATTIERGSIRYSNINSDISAYKFKGEDEDIRGPSIVAACSDSLANASNISEKP